MEVSSIDKVREASIGKVVERPTREVLSMVADLNSS